MKRLTFLIACAVLPASLPAAETLFLPNPAGSTVVAGWVPTNAEIVGGELQSDGPWLSSWPAGAVLPAAFTDGTSSWNLTSNFTGSNFTGPDSIYTFDRTDAQFTVTTTDYAGGAFGKVILQLTPSSDNNRDLQLGASLTIGGITYSGSQATFTSDRAFGGNFSDPTNRYYGHFGGLALVTYEWDLDALGYSGGYSDVSLSWSLPQTHSVLYDAQVSFAAVPEPATAGMAGFGLFVVIARRLSRRHPRVQEA